MTSDNEHCANPEWVKKCKRCGNTHTCMEPFNYNSQDKIKRDEGDSALSASPDSSHNQCCTKDEVEE